MSFLKYIYLFSVCLLIITTGAFTVVLKDIRFMELNVYQWMLILEPIFCAKLLATWNFLVEKRVSGKGEKPSKSSRWQKTMLLLDFVWMVGTISLAQHFEQNLLSLDVMNNLVFFFLVFYKFIAVLLILTVMVCDIISGNVMAILLKTRKGSQM